uniref:Uncharacterized protein n=2 Tax=Opuntia streptacantha TaxID=393608 RepID=A0A7C9AWR7_OPUST
MDGGDDVEIHLGFGNNLDSNDLILELTPLTLGRACMPKMPSPNLLPQLILSPKILSITKAFIQLLPSLPPILLRYAPFLGLHRPEPLCQRRLNVLGRRRWRKRPLEEPPWRRPGWRRRHSGGQRAWPRFAMRIRTRPGAGRGRPRRCIFYIGGFRRRKRTLRVSNSGDGGGNDRSDSAVTVGVAGDGFTVTLPHSSGEVSNSIFSLLVTAV